MNSHTISSAATRCMEKANYGVRRPAITDLGGPGDWTLAY